MGIAFASHPIQKSWRILWFSLTLPLQSCWMLPGHNKLGFSNFESAKWIGPSVHMYLSSNSLATTLNTNTVVINSQVFNSRMEYRIGGKSNGVDIVTPNGIQDRDLCRLVV